MDVGRARAWQRFFDGVVADGAAWPRHLWLAALEDGLAAALGRRAPLVAIFRRDAAELLALEHAREHSRQDERRIAQLETRIELLLQQVDQIMRPRPSQQGRNVAEAEVGTPPFELAGGQPFWSRALRAACFGLLLVGCGLLGGVYLYDARLAMQVDQKLDRHLAELQDSFARAEQGVALGMEAFESESARVRRLRGELAAETSQLTARISESLESMRMLRETAIAELEAQLAAETGEVAAMMGRLRERGAALHGGLDQASAELARLEQHLPALGQTLAALETQAHEGESWLSETMQQLAALQSTVPELSTWLDAEQTRLGALSDAVEQQIEEIKSDGLTLQRAADDLRASTAIVASSLESAEAELEGARARAPNGIAATPSGVAEQADFAMMRGDDVLERAQAEATRRIESASIAAAQELDRLHAEEIAALAEQIAATRVELEQTRTGLVASWQRMDRFVAEQHNQLLSKLDRYAQTMEARVQQLLEALNDMEADAEQKKS